MESDMDSMIALCDRTSNDIRSSLNTLQFLSKKSNKVTSKMVNQLNIGQKDQEKGIFVVMNEIFFRKDIKKYVFLFQSDQHQVSHKLFLKHFFSICKRELKESAGVGKFNYILTMCNNCDFDRLLQGIHENFLTVKFKHSSFELTEEACDWFMYTDKLSKMIRDSKLLIREYRQGLNMDKKI